MAKTYRPYLPDQDFLLPPSLRHWLPEDHLVYFVSDLVDELDLWAILKVYEADESAGLRLLRRDLLVAADPAPLGRRRGISRAGGRQRTRLSHDRRLSEAASDGVEWVLRASPARGVRDGRAP